jgi:hypothetical protein
MKLGILTLHRGVSYGGFLQAFAFSRFLNDAGHEARIIDYCPPHRQRYYQSRFRFDWSGLGLNRGNFRNLSAQRRKRSKIDSFRRAVDLYLPVTKEQFRSAKDLQQANLEFEGYLFGSDQIWNPSTTLGEFDTNYFGGFGPVPSKRISYAASFGKAKLNEDESKEVKQLIENLDHISVREASGVEIISSLTSKPVCQMIDPVFLLSPGSYPVPDGRFIPNEPYVLGFFLQPNSEWKNQQIEVVSKTLSIRCQRMSELEQAHSIDPFQMFAILRNASFVVTDSFHGTALSILSQTPFLSLALEGESSNRNERMTDVLKRFGLSERFIASGASVLPVLDKKLDWDSVHQLISEFSRDATRFINDGLSSTS